VLALLRVIVHGVLLLLLLVFVLEHAADLNALHRLIAVLCVCTLRAQYSEKLLRDKTSSMLWCLLHITAKLLSALHLNYVTVNTTASCHAAGICYYKAYNSNNNSNSKEVYTFQCRMQNNTQSTSETLLVQVQARVAKYW
jgi:hypothetical protein